METQDTPTGPPRIRPPWVSYPGIPPDDFFWREAGEPWLSLVWRPYWNGLDAAARKSCLTRFPPPADWRTSLLDDRLDRLIAEIEAADDTPAETQSPHQKKSGGRFRQSLRLLFGRG